MNNQMITQIAKKNGLEPTHSLLQFAWEVVQQGKPASNHAAYLIGLLKDMQAAIPKESGYAFRVSLFINDAASEPRKEWKFYTGKQWKIYDVPMGETREQLTRQDAVATKAMQMTCLQDAEKVQKSA